MNEHVYKEIVETALEELMELLKRDAAKQRLRRRNDNPLSCILQTVSEEVTLMKYELQINHRLPVASAIAEAIYHIEKAVQLSPGQEFNAIQMLDACLRKQATTTYCGCSGEKLGSVPVYTELKLQYDMAMKWKFRILVQQFTRLVFDQTVGGISMYECRLRTAQTDAVAFAVSRVFGLESTAYSVWCIRQMRVSYRDIQNSKDWLQTFCLQLLAEIFNEREEAIVQLCDLYGEFSSSN